MAQRPWERGQLARNVGAGLVPARKIFRATTRVAPTCAPGAFSHKMGLTNSDAFYALNLKIMRNDYLSRLSIDVG